MELVTVKTADSVELDGALYLPDGDAAEWRAPILAVHGLTWNFYRGPLPPDRQFQNDWELAGIPNRYATQLNLPPGNYQLQEMFCRLHGDQVPPVF